MAGRVKAEFGTIDALFVNAGVNGFAPFEATSEELFDRLLTINAKGPYFTVQKLAPLIAEGGGVVLTTAVANVKALRRSARTGPARRRCARRPAAAAEGAAERRDSDAAAGRTPGEVARAFAFLAFEATYTTNAELTVDGGASQL
ncbi:SDR family oxidoreductase [Nonomuraea rubra]|uniref:SDR family oxidoreductase n=1 Tax=Nonomuraea rubra TaxID=46180 RepID=UPI0024838317|nr:SDR family oxidoreductase [Nonomuraea rubra]